MISSQDSMSMRNDGLTMPDIISKYLGNSQYEKFVAVLIIVTGILVATTFAKGAADLLTET